MMETTSNALDNFFEEVKARADQRACAFLPAIIFKLTENSIKAVVHDSQKHVINSLPVSDKPEHTLLVKQYVLAKRQYNKVRATITEGEKAAYKQGLDSLRKKMIESQWGFM